MTLALLLLMALVDDPYRLQPGVFPPKGTEHRIEGKLTEADFIHRLGQLRRTDNGELVDFNLLPFATVMASDIETDLRDIPLGTPCSFSLYPDDRGDFNRVAAIQWACPEDQKVEIRRRHEAFLKERGLAAWIDRVDGKKLTVTLFGDPASLQDLCHREKIDPARWATEHRSIDAVVANEELRTYNPPVDRKRAKVLEFQAVPTDGHGCSGLRWVIEPELLLEGFRKGRIIRLFAHPSWPVKDMPFGETLYTEAPNVRPALEEPLQYPFRTDFANEDLPWYQLKPGEFPPLRSDHQVVGELLDLDLARRSGHFRADRSGQVVDFTILPFAPLMHLDAEANPADLTIGTRYDFSLYQDARGEFTRAAQIQDDFTRSATDSLTYRLDSVDLAAGKLQLAWRHAPVLDEKEALIQPPDLGRGEFAMDARTRIWKGDKQVAPSDLALGDELLLNQSGRTATSRGVCSDIWIGRETHKLATDRQRSKHDASLEEGVPAWVERVDGRTLTIEFFTGNLRHLRTLLRNERAQGDGLTVTAVDDELRPTRPASKLRLRQELRSEDAVGGHGASGIRWRVELEEGFEPFPIGQILRVTRAGWPGRAQGDPR